MQDIPRIFVGDFDPASLPKVGALRSHFSHYGSVVGARIFEETRKAYVDFKTQEEADLIVR